MWKTFRYGNEVIIFPQNFETRTILSFFLKIIIKCHETRTGVKIVMYKSRMSQKQKVMIIKYFPS